jgi:hypothetical protein
VARQRIADLQRALVAGGTTYLVTQQVASIDAEGVPAPAAQAAALAGSLAFLQAAREQHVAQLRALLRLRYGVADRRSEPRDGDADSKF